MTFVYVRRTAFQEEQPWVNKRPFVVLRIRARENLDMHANQPAAGRCREGKGDTREKLVTEGWALGTTEVAEVTGRKKSPGKGMFHLKFFALLIRVSSLQRV